MKSLLSGLIITLILALSIFAASQFQHLSLQAIENIIPKNKIIPTVEPSPTVIPTAAPTVFSGSQKTFIYLYPSKFIPMSIKLADTLKVSNALPKYPKNGWYIITTSQSLIENQYNYLSFDNDIDNFSLPNSGWIVSNTNIKNWLETNLPNFGLNQKEISQFKSYCLSKLKNSPYYQISYSIPKDKLLVNPPVDNTLRYSFYFTNLDSAVALPAPTVITPNRDGTSVVELSAAFAN